MSWIDELIGDAMEPLGKRQFKKEQRGYQLCMNVIW